MNERTNFIQVELNEHESGSVKSSAQAASEAFIKTPKIQSFIGQIVAMKYTKKRDQKVNIKELEQELIADKSKLTNKIAELLESQSMF